MTHPNLHLVEYDLTDLGSSIRLLQKATGASEIYNLAAQSFVGVSFDQPTTTAQITGLGALQPARGHPHRRIRRHPLLPGLHVGNVRQGAGDSAERRHAVLSAQPVRRGQALRALDDGQLPRVLRHLRHQRHPVQPRVAAARPRVRDAQDHRLGGQDQAGQARRARAGQPRRQARLGLTPRSMSRACGACCRPTSPTPSCWRPIAPRRCATSSAWRSSAAEIDSPLGRRGRTGARIRRRRRTRAGAHQPAVLSPGRSRPADRRPGQGQGEARLGADDVARRPVPR